MNWFLIDKSRTQQPAGTYRDWKGVLREEGRKQCVYCAIHEANFGGMRNFHVEHYRPKSRFDGLKNNIANLFYSCGICNSFKGSDWPNDPSDEYTVAAYPDPSICDYSEILDVNDEAVVQSEVVAGRYLIERLFLNRPQLILARKAARLRGDLRDLSVELKERAEHAPLKVAERLVEVIELLAAIPETAPYEDGDVKRHA